jgi:hypothetical protein
MLILAQAAHSIEEYVFRLFDVFAPAAFVSGLLSHDLATGFATANTILILLAVSSYVASVRCGHPSAHGLAWFWAVLELANGVSHTLLALTARRYVPGLATAPLLLIVSLTLIARLSTPPNSAIHS